MLRSPEAKRADVHETGLGAKTKGLADSPCQRQPCCYQCPRDLPLLQRIPWALPRLPQPHCCEWSSAHLPWHGLWGLSPLGGK